MLVYDKLEIREALRNDDIFDLVQEFGGDPSHTGFGFLSSTICHNPPGEGSRKLYYYENTGLFKCFTGCDEYFDVFQLVIKVAKIQWDKDFNLNDSIRWIAQRFNIAGETIEEDEYKTLEDWKIFNNYDRIQQIETKSKNIILKEYNPIVLTRFNYDVKIQPWLDEGISQDILNKSIIGFYPGGDQITIPHFDENNRLIGVRGRTLVKEVSEVYGKYMPLKINNQFYTHPLGMNLYNFNNSKNNIKRMKKAIVFEGKRQSRPSPLFH